MRNRWIAALLTAVLTACASPATVAPVTPAPVPGIATRSATPQQIRNVIFVVQMDRSFNDLFAGFPGADSALDGRTHTGTTIPLKSESLAAPLCTINGYRNLTPFQTIYDNGKMDGWDLLDKSDPHCPYTRVVSPQTKPLWQLASSYTLGDKTFGSTDYGDFVDLQYIIAGSTKIAPNTYVVSAPLLGCDAPPGTSSVILKNGRIDFNGPFPCFTRPTIATLLDAHHVSWRWYAAAGTPWNPWLFVKAVREGPDWKRISIPETNVFSDLKNGTLADVSWVTPSGLNSDAPGTGGTGGPKWVESVVSAVQRSKYWNHAAVVVLWDDAGQGQFYDPAAPPIVDTFGLGFRVGLVAISPYAQRGLVSHAQFETGGSTLKFIEENWQLGSLGATDVRANSVGELFVK